MATEAPDPQAPAPRLGSIERLGRWWVHTGRRSIENFIRNLVFVITLLLGGYLAVCSLIAIPQLKPATTGRDELVTIVTRDACPLNENSQIDPEGMDDTGFYNSGYDDYEASRKTTDCERRFQERIRPVVDVAEQRKRAIVHLATARAFRQKRLVRRMVEDEALLRLPQLPTDYQRNRLTGSLIWWANKTCAKLDDAVDQCSGFPEWPSAAGFPSGCAPTPTPSAPGTVAGAPAPAVPAKDDEATAEKSFASLEADFKGATDKLNVACKSAAELDDLVLDPPNDPSLTDTETSGSGTEPEETTNTISKQLTSWLLRSNSISLALITGMLGYGLLGSTVSTAVRDRAKGRELSGRWISDLLGAVLRGVSASIAVFLAVNGGLAVFALGAGPANPYVTLFICFIVAVFSEEAWDRIKGFAFESRAAANAARAASEIEAQSTPDGAQNPAPSPATTTPSEGAT